MNNLLKGIKRTTKKAFTLIELVVVIAVIAILAGVSVAAYFGVTESAKKSAALQEAEQLVTLVNVVAADGEKVPVGANTFELSVSSKGLEIKSTAETPVDITSAIAVDVFEYVYFVGTEGEGATVGDRFSGANPHATLTFYGEDAEIDGGTVVVAGFGYTMDGATEEVGIAANFKASEDTKLFTAGA